MLPHAVPYGCWPANGARARHQQGSRPGAKGAGQMRTLRELETEGEIINDPIDDSADLGEISDPQE